MTKTQKLPAIRGEIQLFHSANTDSNESGDQSFLTPRHLEKKLMEEIKIKDIRTADDQAIQTPAWNLEDELKLLQPIKKINQMFKSKYTQLFKNKQLST